MSRIFRIFRSKFYYGVDPSPLFKILVYSQNFEIENNTFYFYLKSIVTKVKG